MHAFLTSGDNIQDIVLKQNIKTQITFVLQKIDDARELKKILKFKTGEKTAVVINDIDSATEEALNAFLKVLEEPGENINFILTAKNLENVIPTIVSRCEVVKNRKLQEPKNQNNLKIKNFINSNLEQKIFIIERIKDRGDAIKFIEDLIYFEYQNGNLNRMDNYLNTIKNIKLNGNIGLQLLNLVVRMNGNGKN